MLQTLQHSYSGLSLILRLNWDRLLSVGTIALALAAWTYVFGF